MALLTIVKMSAENYGVQCARSKRLLHFLGFLPYRRKQLWRQ
jgi:hypothetical protein